MAEKRDVVITRTFDAPVEQVWKAWTEPEFVMRWWGPTGFTSPSCKMNECLDKLAAVLAKR